MASVPKCGTTYTPTTLGVSTTTLIGGPSPITLMPNPAFQLGSNMINGSASIIQPGDACYIKTSDGKVYPAQSNGTDGTSNADKVRGFAGNVAYPGQPVTLWRNLEWNYYNTGSYTALPGNPVYLSSTTAGGLVDAPSFAGQPPVGYFIDFSGRMFLGPMLVN